MRQGSFPGVKATLFIPSLIPVNRPVTSLNSEAKPGKDALKKCPNAGAADEFP
jgi:hypothetical protein